MWQIEEHHDIQKICRRLPENIQKKYDFWKSVVAEFGPAKLVEFPSFHDEKLSGDRQGQRSSRLNLKYRVIYEIENEVVTVFVVEITPHKY